MSVSRPADVIPTVYVTLMSYVENRTSQLPVWKLQELETLCVHVLDTPGGRGGSDSLLSMLIVCTPAVYETVVVNEPIGPFGPLMGFVVTPAGGFSRHP